MNISNKLQELTQEILSFGEVINFTENPADLDFCNACELFSKHLSYELQTINSNVCFQDIRPDMQQTTAQLYQLSELITPAQSSTEDSKQWSNKLVDFCDQLKTLRDIAA